MSESLRRLYIRLGCTTEAKTCVLAVIAPTIAFGKGSPSGIYADPSGLYTDEIPQSLQVRERAQALRAQLGIPDGAPVVGFVGRITRDKGLPELLDAFDLLLTSVPDAWLLILGRFEDGDPIPESYMKRLRSHPRVVMTGFVSDPDSYYRIMDVVALPSHREGLAGPPLEAALVAEVPSVVFQATGIVDAVCDGITGTIVPFGAALESSVPGLHFLGALAARSFGPLCRFVSGTPFTARALTRRVLGENGFQPNGF